VTRACAAPLADTVANEAARLYIAPHYDDVALSAGGQVALDARTSSPTIVTVFAAQSTAPSGEFARFQHARWGFDDSNAVARRQAEDACAARALGATVRTLWLDELDAIYRDPAYDSDAALFGRARQGDAAVVPRVVAALTVLHASACFVPLGVGNHVDHQLAFRVGQALAQGGHVVWAYADLPYALDDAALTRRLALGGVGALHLVTLDADAWARKLRAVACYASQLPVLFREQGDPAAALTLHARALGGGVPVEALWRVEPGADPWASVSAAPR
jgi:LmbE family N-acetylglucosaminyl deacetylase